VTLVVCGAPLAARTPDIVAAMRRADWTVVVVGTPSAVPWLDADAIAGLTGSPVRFDFRTPDRPKSVEPSAVVVCPATFNSVNKAAIGAADTFALSVMCEAIGAGIPVVAVPMVNRKLWGHPAWPAGLDTLRRAGVVLVDIADGRDGTSPVESGTGAAVAVRFDPAWVVARLPER